MMARGFYSVVQYCPDRFRAEAVNVGLVLLCTEPHAVRVRMADNLDRVRKLFAIPKPDLKNLKLSTQGLTSRIEKSLEELQTAEDLAAFAASRANDLRLSEPRLAKVEDFEVDFRRLFSQLVDSPSTTALTVAALAVESPAEILPPKLGEVFYRLQQEQKIWQPGEITVPIFKRRLEIPYAYKNGVTNLVKPHVFPSTKRAETQAATLAVNGDLIRKHPVNGEERRLIVVSTQEDSDQAAEISEHVEPLFKEYGVRLIRPQDVAEFAEEVQISAH
jgi:hypothetical protein